MQRAPSSLRKSCRLCSGIRCPPVLFEHSQRRTRVRGRTQPFSIVRCFPPSSPFLDFLHPRIVKQALKSSRRFEDVRRYHSNPDYDGHGLHSEGWSASELERQDNGPEKHERFEKLARTTEKLFAELDTIPEPPKHRQSSLLNRITHADKELGDFVPELKSYAAMYLAAPPQKREIIETYDPSLSIEQQSALNAWRVIIHGMIEDRQQQAIDIYKANNIEAMVDNGEKYRFASYLYHSRQRSHLEDLLHLFPNSKVVVPVLCRLGRLDEARHIALTRLRESGKNKNCVQVYLVMDEYAKRKDWKTVIDIWEEAVMTPTVLNVNKFVSENRKNVVLENCLVTIPNVKEWYIEKAAKVVSDADASPKMVQYIKTLGGVLVKGFAKNNIEVVAAELLRYQLETFGEIDEKVLFWQLHSLRRNGRPKAAVELYLSYRNNAFATIVRSNDDGAKTGRNIKLNIQNEAMASASLLNNFPIIKQIFEDIYTLKLEPDGYSYAIIMHAFARHGQANTVQELFETYVKTGRKPDIYLYAELLYVQVMLLDIPGVEKTFQLIKDSGLDTGMVTYNMITTAYSRTLNVESAMRVFREYLRLGNSPTAEMIGHLISMFANRNDTDAAVEMFNLLGEFGLNPQVGLFNQLLCAYANVGDQVNAEAVMAKMRELGVKPDVVTWSTLLKVYAQRKEMNSIVDVLARMRRGGIEPNGFIWAQAMDAFVTQGGTYAVTCCRRIMNRLVNLRIPLEVFHWNILLEATIVSTGDLLQMQQVYDEMIDKGVRPNSATHAILVGAYCKYGGRSGLEISEGIVSRLTSINQHLDLTARRSPRTALSPSLFTPLFRTQGPNLPLDDVAVVFDGYINSTASVGGCPAEPDLDMLTALIHTYREHHDIEAVRRVWRAIKEHADNASRSFRSTSESTEEFVVAGNRFLLCTPFSHYMRALADANELDEIDTVWDQLSQNGYDFNCENWNTRIKICLSRRKHIVWAFRACEEVLMDGWETRLRYTRKWPRNPPPSVRASIERRRSVALVNRIFWPIEADLMDFGPPGEYKRDKLLKPEFYPYETTLYEFIVLRRELLRGASIVDTSGRRRPGPEVWERLKQAFPRIVRAMFLHLKAMTKHERARVALGFDKEFDIGTHTLKTKGTG